MPCRATAGRRSSCVLHAGGQLDAQFLDLVTNPEDEQTVYGWDDNGNLTSQSDALKRTTTFEYNELDRRTLRTYPGDTSETFVHDANGQIRTYDYDAFDRLELETDRLEQQITHGYDAREEPGYPEEPGGKNRTKNRDTHELLGDPSVAGTVGFCELLKFRSGWLRSGLLHGWLAVCGRIRG